MKISETKLTFLYLVLGVIVCIVLNSVGLSFAVPGEKIRNIVFENEGNVRNNLPTLIEERRIIRDMIKSGWAEYSPDYDTKELIPFLYNSKKIYIERNVVNGMRSYLLRTLIPDEGVLTTLERMHPYKFDFNPHYFAYGGFYIYSTGLYLFILKSVGILNITRDTGYYLLNPGEMGKIYIALRFLNTLLAAGSFFLIFLIGCKLQGHLHGFLSSLFYIVTPGIVIGNHLARPHVFILFWILLTMYFFVRALQDEKFYTKNFMLACIFTGLVMGGFLPYGILIFLLIPITVFLKTRNSTFIASSKYYVRTVLFGFLLAVGIFLLTNPYLLVSFREVLTEYKYTKMDAKIEMSIQNYLYYLTVVLKMHLGSFLWILFLICLCISMYRPKKEEWIVLFPFLAGFLFIGASTPNYLMRFVFFLPFTVLIIGDGISKLLCCRKLSAFIVGIIVMGFLYTGLYTFAHLNLFQDNDMRFVAGEWINNNLPQNTSIGLMEAPVAFRTPPFSFAKYKVLIINNREKFKKEIPDYFVTSSFDWRFSDYEKTKEYLQNYQEYKIFRRNPSLFGLEFRTKGEKLPSDYCYLNPVITIWKRTE